MNDHTPKINLTFVIRPEYDILGYRQISASAPSDIRPDNLLRTNDEIAARVREQFFRDAVVLKKRTFEIETAWKLLDINFNKLALSVFDSSDIPKETYECYPTICPLISRDPLLHRIGFPYAVSDNEACFVIAHEILHELFYHHVDRVFGKKTDLNSRTVWDLSEVINVLIMRRPEWQAVFPYPVKPYPVHKALLITLMPIWERSKNLDEFLITYLDNGLVFSVPT